MIATEIPGTPAAPATPFQAPPAPATPFQAPAGQATPFQAPAGQTTPFQAPAGQATPFQAPAAPVTPFQAPELGYCYEPPFEEAAPPTEAGMVPGAQKQSTVALDEAGVRKLTMTTMILLLLISAVMGLLLIFILFSSSEESFIAVTPPSIALEPDETVPHPSTKRVAPTAPAGRRTTVIGPEVTDTELPSNIGMCNPPPGVLCPGKVAPMVVDRSLVVFDQSDHSCRNYRHGPNCLVGDNRFRDMDSCRAACTGPQPQPACSAPVHFRSCIPGADTNSSAYYNYGEYCLEVAKGSCLRGRGFGSQEECEDACQEGPGNEAAECHVNDVRLCTISEQLYQIAFIGGRCERRVDICPKSVGFTSISHCIKTCRRITYTVPLVTPVV